MPVGANDKGDINATPITAVEFDTGIVKRATINDIPAMGNAGRERIRVDSIITGTAAGVIIVTEAAAPYVVTIAEDDTFAAGISTDELIFDISTQIGSLGGVPLAGMPYISNFAISCTLETGLGVLDIYYRTSNTGTWRLYEPIPVSLANFVDKDMIPSRAQYKIFYTSDAGIITTGLDLQIILYAPSK